MRNNKKAKSLYISTENKSHSYVLLILFSFAVYFPLRILKLDFSFVIICLLWIVTISIWFKYQNIQIYNRMTKDLSFQAQEKKESEELSEIFKGIAFIFFGETIKKLHKDSQVPLSISLLNCVVLVTNLFYDILLIPLASLVVVFVSITNLFYLSKQIQFYKCFKNYGNIEDAKWVNDLE